MFAVLGVHRHSYPHQHVFIGVYFVRMDYALATELLMAQVAAPLASQLTIYYIFAVPGQQALESV